jgi:hypothetical protein
MKHEHLIQILRVLPDDLPEQQGSTDDQLRALYPFAVKLGLQDAAHFIKMVLESGR